MDFTRKNWTVSLKSTDAKVVYRALVHLRGLFKKRAGNFKVDKECFSVILSFLKSSNHQRQSMALSLLGYACLKLNYRILFMRSKSAVQNLLNVLDNCVVDEVLCRAWRLTGNLLRTWFANLAFFNNELKERFQNRLDVEVLKNMHADTRTCLAMAFKYFWRIGQFSPELFEQLMKLVTSVDTDIVCFTLDLVNSVIEKPPKFELTSETVETLIALTKHSDQKISHAAVSILVKKYAQKSIAEIEEPFRIAFAYVDDLTVNPRALNDVTMKVMAQFTRESNVRNKLKHSSLLKTVLHYGIAKKMTEVIAILNNYQYDQDVINVCANDGTIVKHLIAMVPTDSSIEIILQGLARSPLIHQEIASVKSLKTLLGFRKCWPVLRAIVGSEKHTKEILLSGLCWALEKAGCIFDTKINTYHIFNTIKNYNLMSKSENHRNLSLSFPFIVERGNYAIMGEYLNEMHGLTLLVSALEANPSDDGAAHAVFRLCEWFSLSRHKEFETDSYRMQLILNAYNGLKRLEECDWKPRELGGLKGEMVTILVNGGMRVRWDRNQLSEMSPVFSAMLNGSFIEAGQDCVKFTNCSAAGLSALLKMMTSEINLNKVPVDVRLEMLELADRLLIPQIDQVIACSIETKPNCLNLYPWVRDKGYLLDSVGARFINASGYFHTFRDAGCFTLLLKNQSTQKLLVEDVKEYLQTCYNDMLAI